MTLRRVAELNGERVRLWAGPVLLLTGEPVIVSPYGDEHVRIGTKWAYGSAVTVRADVLAYQEESGTWTVTI